jgi:hypothetical protein
MHQLLHLHKQPQEKRSHGKTSQLMSCHVECPHCYTCCCLLAILRASRCSTLCCFNKPVHESSRE